jgi:hypothetical protein
MTLEEIFSKLIEQTFDLSDFSIEFFKNRTENSIKYNEYELSILKYTGQYYEINISNSNWVIDHYKIDVFSYEALVLKFSIKTQKLVENKTKEWLDDKKKLERKLKLNNLGKK